MASVKVRVAGGVLQDIDASTVEEAREAVDAHDYQVAVNGETVEDDYQLRNNDFVSFSKPVKAG